MPYPVHQLLYFIHVIAINAAGCVDTLRDLVEARRDSGKSDVVIMEFGIVSGVRIVVDDERAQVGISVTVDGQSDFGVEDAEFIIAQAQVHPKFAIAVLIHVEPFCAGVAP